MEVEFGAIFTRWKKGFRQGTCSLCLVDSHFVGVEKN
jgi:hypothetical protein